MITPTVSPMIRAPNSPSRAPPKRVNKPVGTLISNAPNMLAAMSRMIVATTATNQGL
ncbi:MAG: hypothetical protein BWY77_01842 [bacterium ADurb.Bin431]|nr:MAG: hypothetical protein BWY77_01842 [bacterium ADurb.Bin431]